MPNFELTEDVIKKYPGIKEAYDEEVAQHEQEKQKKLEQAEAEKRERERARPSGEERRELGIITGARYTFEVPTRFRRFIGIKTSKWYFKHLPLVVICRMNEQALNLWIEPDQLNEMGLVDVKRLTVEQGKTLARIVAIAVVGMLPFGDFLRNIMTNYFYYRMSHQMFLPIQNKLNENAEYGNFLLSITLTYARRLTEPVVVEVSKKG